MLSLFDCFYYRRRPTAFRQENRLILRGSHVIVLLLAAKGDTVGSYYRTVSHPDKVSKLNKTQNIAQNAFFVSTRYFSSFDITPLALNKFLEPLSRILQAVLETISSSHVK
jgi:hypothetical protein